MLVQLIIFNHLFVMGATIGISSLNGHLKDSTLIERKITGTFIPPQTGEYKFFSSCSLPCAVFLDFSNLMNEQFQIINQDRGVGEQRVFDRFPEQVSHLIYLEAGVPVFLRASSRYAEKKEKQHVPDLSVGILLPDDSKQFPISADLLSDVVIQNERIINKKLRKIKKKKRRVPGKNLSKVVRNFFLSTPSSKTLKVDENVMNIKGKWRKVQLANSFIKLKNFMLEEFNSPKHVFKELGNTKNRSANFQRMNNYRKEDTYDKEEKSADQQFTEDLNKLEELLVRGNSLNLTLHLHELEILESRLKNLKKDFQKNLDNETLWFQNITDRDGVSNKLKSHIRQFNDTFNTTPSLQANSLTSSLLTSYLSHQVFKEPFTNLFNKSNNLERKKKDVYLKNNADRKDCMFLEQNGVNRFLKEILDFGCKKIKREKNPNVKILIDQNHTRNKVDQDGSFVNKKSKLVNGKIKENQTSLSDRDKMMKESIRQYLQNQDSSNNTESAENFVQRMMTMMNNGEEDITQK